MSKSLSKYFNMTIRECEGLSSTERQIARKLAEEDSSRFKTKTVVEMLLNRSLIVNTRKPVLKRMLARSNIRK